MFKNTLKNSISLIFISNLLTQINAHTYENIAGYQVGDQPAKHFKTTSIYPEPSSHTNYQHKTDAQGKKYIKKTNK